MKRIVLTLAVLAALGAATTPPAAHADPPVLTHGHEFHHHHGYYGGWGPAVVRRPVWGYSTAVVPYVAPPFVGVPQYYYYCPPYYYGGSNMFPQYYSPAFSFGLNF